MYWASPLSASVSDNHHDLLQSSPSEWDFQRFLSEASVSDNHHDLLQPSSPSPAASSSVVPLLFSQEMVQQKLQALMESAKESWIYAIFWQSSVDVAGPTLLGWGDGYYKGEDDSRRRPKASAAENEHRKRVLKELNSLISGASASDDASDEDVTDTEWFFLVSMTQSFVNGSGLPGQSFFSTFPIWLSGADQLNASPCDRARQAQIFGIQTMVCIPFGYGVVEVGSTNHIINDSDLLNKARILFNFGDGGWPYLAKNDPLVHCIEEPSSATRVETKEHLAFRETKNFFVEVKSTTDLQQRKRVVVRRKLKEKRKLVEELPSTGTDTRFQGKEVEVKNEKLEERKILQEESPPASELEGREKLDEFPPTQEFEKGKKMEEEFPPTSGFEERIIKRIPGLEKGKRFEENKKQEPDTSHEDEDCSIPPKILQWEKKVEIPLLTYTTNQVDTRIMISDFEKSIENDVQNRMEKTLREERLITIPKIPAGIRQGMNEYYEPRIISIGPYHRDKPELRYMEKRKWLYLDALLSRNKNRSLKDYVDITVEFEDRVRSCYQRNDEFQSEDFVKMMLVDGCFIVEYLMQLDSDNLDQVKLCEMVWMQSVVHNDMLLLENQLPFYLLLCIFELTTENRYPISFINLAHKFFRRVSPTDLTGVPPLISPSQVHHLLHLYHMSLFPTPIDVNDCNPPANLLARVKSRCMNLISCRPSTLKENPSLAETSPNLKALETGPFLTKMIPSARALEEAGIKFKKKDGGSILDAKFHKGVLEIPPLLVDAFTMSRFRNLIALEKLFPLTFKEPLFTAYVQFLDYLINTYKDIQLLQKEGIITHALGSDEEVARLFNGLTSGTFDYQPDHLKKMYDEVEKYCKAKKHIWRAILMRDYFSNPWAAFSVGAAVILLIFTFLQTFFSMYGYFRPPSGSS